MKTYWDYCQLCIDLLYRRLTQGSRVEPTFLMLGTPRSGTSSLYSYLLQHPDYVPPLMKEMGYRRSETAHGAFNSMFYMKMPRIVRPRAQGLLEGLYFSGSDTGYKKLFPKRTEMLGARNGYRKTTADFLVFGIYAPVFDREIVKLSQQKKVLFMVRKPADYLFSYFIHEQKNFWRSNLDRELGFDAFARNPFALFGQGREECAEFLTSIAAELFPEVDFREDDALILPWIAYARYLKWWLQELGPENVMIIHSEEFFANPHDVMDRVFCFLGMAPHRIEDRTVLNANTYEQKMSPETRIHIHNCAKPYNQELYELLGKDLGWDEM